MSGITRFDYAKLPYAAADSKEPDWNRMNWRCQLMLTDNQAHLQGKRVLDLACNNGRLSYACLALGAAAVTGVEARRISIDEGKGHLDGTGFEARMSWVESDLFSYLESVSPGEFDVILGCGFLYHTARQVDFFREMKRIAPRTVIIDTSVFKNYISFGRKGVKKAPCLLMIVEDPALRQNTTDVDGVAYWPSRSYLEAMFEMIGYDYRRIVYDPARIKNWAGLRDYRRGHRDSYIAHARA